VSVSGNGSSASTDSWFDANGFLVATDRSESTPDKPLGNALVNDAQGRVLYNNQGAARPFDTNTAGFGRIENQAGGFIGGFIGNDSNRGHVQRQLIVNGEVLARYGDELVAKLNSTTFTPTSVAEFQFGAAPLNVRQSNLDAQRYTVSDGETLRSIARSFYGDDKLWYLIAQANGLSGSTQLSTGQTLSIPKLSASSNAADSFKPYDPSKVVGDLTPNLPMPQNDKGCGALGQIIMIVVAIVVTIYTAGAAATSLSSAAAASSAAGASTMSIGAGALLGGTGAAAGMSAGSLIAAGAIGGAVGSIASQLVGNAIGAVDGFSWKQVALGGLSAGMGAGLGQIAALAGTTPGAVIARAAIGDAMTQGIALVTGLQDHFDWKGVAASAVGAGVGYGMNEAFGLTQNGLATNNYTGFDKYALAGLSGFAAGTAAAAARGGRVSVQQVATDAFGNAIGSSLVDAMSSPQESIYSLAGGAGQPGIKLGVPTGVGLRMGDNRATLPAMSDDAFAFYEATRDQFAQVRSEGPQRDFDNADVYANWKESKPLVMTDAGPGRASMTQDQFRRSEIAKANAAAEDEKQAQWNQFRQGAWNGRTTQPNPVSPGYKAVSALAGMVSDGLGVVAGAAVTGTGIGLTATPEPTTLTKWAGVPLIAYGATYATKSAVGFGLNATNFYAAVRGITDEASYLPGSLLEWGVRAVGGTPDQERLAVATDMAWGLANGKLLDARLATGVIMNPRVAALLQPATLTTVSREATLAAPQTWQAWTRLDPKAGVVDWFFKTNDNIFQPEFFSTPK